MSKICCFTGHRSINSSQYGAIQKKLFAVLCELVENDGVTDFRAGGAVGFDTLAAFCVLALKKRYPHIKLHLILPCKDQDKNFREDMREFYRYVIKVADSVTYTQEKYHSGVMLIRNRALVDGADVCVAYLKSLKGGTYQTVNLARRAKVKVINIAKE